ncbi:hypothetical protein MHYP_G00337180 [Metynnis hypsauchen]
MGGDITCAAEASTVIKSRKIHKRADVRVAVCLHHIAPELHASPAGCLALHGDASVRSARRKFLRSRGQAHGPRWRRRQQIRSLAATWSLWALNAEGNVMTAPDARIDSLLLFFPPVFRQPPRPPARRRTSQSQRRRRDAYDQS